jgi:hypothetical protein
MGLIVERAAMFVATTKLAHDVLVVVVNVLQITI